MEIKIGVQHSPRELSIDVDLATDEIEKLVTEALPGGVFSVTDTKGRRVLVPAANLAYVDISTSVSGQVGFRS